MLHACTCWHRIRQRQLDVLWPPRQNAAAQVGRRRVFGALQCQLRRWQRQLRPICSAAFRTGSKLQEFAAWIVVTNQADVAAWNLPTVSPMPVFLTADYLWGAMEGHYSSHFFEVRIYVYDPAMERYKLRHKYYTKHRYPGIDNWEQAPEVLEKERGRIIEASRAK